MTEPIDIFSLGFDKNLNKEIADNSTGVVYDAVNDTTNVGNILSGGQLTLKSLSIGGLVRQVAPGDDIQAAIDAVAREGGGTVQLFPGTYRPKTKIEMASSVKLVGSGNGVTFLDFEGTIYNLSAHGLSSDFLKNWSIQDIQVKSSAATAGLDISRSQDFILSNVSVTLCSGVGIRIRGSRNFSLSNIDSSDNTGDNLVVNATDTISGSRNFVLLNCVADDSLTGSGIVLSHTEDSVTSDAQLQNFTLLNCSAEGNANYGVDIQGNSAFNAIFGAKFIGVKSLDNTSGGFRVAHLSESVFVACSANGTQTGSTWFISYTGSNLPNKFIGCDGVISDSSNSHSNIYIAQDSVWDEATITSFTELSIISPHENITPPQTREIILAKNVSGGTLRAGNVAVFSPVDSGDEVSTTTTNGSNKVFGVAVESINSTAYGRFLVSGKTSTLYVANGTSSISVGDWLSTYSHAYYAKKAVAGDMVFAMALSAPTTSTAQINALLVSPRLI